MTNVTRVNLPIPGMEPRETVNNTPDYHAKAAQIARDAGVTSRAGSTAYRTDAAGNQHQSGHVHVQMGEVSNGEKGILSTLKAQGSGMAKAVSDAKPTDRIVVNGMETTVGVALQLGILKKDTNGSVYEPGTDERARDAQAAPTHNAEDEADTADEDATEPLMPAAEEAFTEIVNKTHVQDRLGALDQITKTGEVSRVTLEQAASHMGVHPDQLGQGVQGLIEHFKAQASAAVQKQLGNVDIGAFWEWANNDPSARKMFETAGRDHVIARHTRSYAALAREYAEGFAERNPQAVLSAQCPEGVSVRQFNGKVLVKTPFGPETDFRTAIKMGWIKAPVRT